MGVITIGEGGMLRIPEELLEQAHLKDGLPVSLRLSAEGEIVIQSEARDPDQWWFWTEEWQEGEREVEADKAAGRVSGPFTDEEFSSVWQTSSGSCLLSKPLPASGASTNVSVAGSRVSFLRRRTDLWRPSGWDSHRDLRSV